MKRIYSFLFVTLAMLMLSVSTAWADTAYVKVTAPDGVVSWIPIVGTIDGTNIVIYREGNLRTIDVNTKGSIDLNEVWSEIGGSGTHYQVTSIGSSAFYYCRGLTSISIPSSVTSIGASAFYGCSGLTSAVIPSSVTSIENGLFYDCISLTSVVIPSNVTSIGNVAFVNCHSLTSVVIPYGVTSIGYEAFDCSGLTSIEIPSSVTRIGEKAFWFCGRLTSIVIPSSVTSIGDCAFYNCSGLSSITSYITDLFETGTNVFFGCDNATLYVPKGLVNNYQSTADWNRIKKIEEIPGIALAMSCNNKGKVIINDGVQFTNNMGEVSVYEEMENHFFFTPEENCQLEQVLIDGLDVTLSVKNNQLTTKIRENSKMIVMFSKSRGDMNGDGMVNISDVVALVNLILGQ